MSTGADEIVTTADAREYMSDTLELIAGIWHEVIRGDIHKIRGVTQHSSYFQPDTCPVCMATKCLEQIDEAENRPEGLL